MRDTQLQIWQIMARDHCHAANQLHIGNAQPAGCMLWENVAVDEVLKALAEPSRRLLLDSLNTRDGQSLRELCAGLSMARQSVSKHLAVLEAADLVTTKRQGREKLHYLNAEPIRAIAERWLSQYARAPAQPRYRWIEWHDALDHP